MSNTFERLTGVNEARVVQVIEIKSLAGNGDSESPMHEVTEYYSFDGELLARKTLKGDLPIGRWLGHNKAPLSTNPEKDIA
jgi:hypothetical protein